MSHARKVLVVALALVLAGASAFAQAPAEPKPAWPSFVFSIFLGFGTGQYWAGQNGNLFLVADVSCLTVLTTGAVLALSLPPSPGAGFSAGSAGYLMISISAIAYCAFRIWELLDVFGAVDRARKAGAVAFLEPVVGFDPTSLEVGVMLHL